VDENGDYLEEADNAEGERARVLYAREVDPADPPGSALRQRAVRMEPMLTLPELDPALGLEAFAGRGYDDVLGALIQADKYDVWDGEQWAPDHWLGGRRGPYAPGMTTLLQFGSDSRLAFDFLDAGLIRFTIPTADLASADLSRVSVITESS